jgi:hypothetical protein
MTLGQHQIVAPGVAWIERITADESGIKDGQYFDKGKSAGDVDGLALVGHAKDMSAQGCRFKGMSRSQIRHTYIEFNTFKTAEAKLPAETFGGGIIYDEMGEIAVGLP